MDEVLPGVFYWTAKHPNHGMKVDCHYVAGSGTAIDPLLPEEGMDWLDERGVARILLSTRHHLRQAPEIADHFDCQIHCHESGLHEFEGGPFVRGFAFGDRLADEIVALEMDSISPDDTVLRIEAGDGALLFADSVTHRGELGFMSDKLIGDDHEVVKRQTRARCAALLESEQFDSLLFAHGAPVIGGGRDALRAFAAG